MEVTLRPDIAKLLRGTDSVDEFVNNLILAYLDGRFIRKSEIAGIVHTGKMHRRSHMIGVDVYDAITHQFQGVTVEGRAESESLFIPSERLYDLLHDNATLIVMESPRVKKPPIGKPEAVFSRVPKESMA